MKASIIIPTYNRAEKLKITIDSLLKSKNNEKRWEIIVVDDGSNKQNYKMIANLVKLDKKIRVFHKENGGPGSARNMAVERARGDVLIFINDDTLVDDHFVDQHINFHEKNKNKNESLLGPFLVPDFTENSPAMSWLVNKSGLNFVFDENIIKDNTAPWFYYWTCNLSTKKSFFIDNKLKFDETFPTAAWEDIEFGFRAKEFELLIKYDKKLVAYHNHNFNFEDIMARFYSHGRGLYHYRMKVPEGIWPPLARNSIRSIFKYLLADWYMLFIEKNLKNSQYLPNILMQMLVIYNKIKGFQFEESIGHKSDMIYK